MIEIFMTAIAASGISGLAVRSVYRREVETRLRIEISRIVAEEKNKIVDNYITIMTKEDWLSRTMKIIKINKINE